MIFLISLRFSSLNALQWTWCMQNSNHAGRKGAEFSLLFKGTPNFLPQLAPLDNFPRNRNPPFCKKRDVTFPHEHMAQICTSPTAFCAECNSSSPDFCTEINSDPAELRWCLWRLAGSLVPQRCQVLSCWRGKHCCEVRNESQVTAPVSDLYKFVLSIVKQKKMR